MGLRRRSSSREDRGAALVEAALVLPILLLLTFGIWTTARAWNVGNTLDHAAREAARYGATVDPWDGGTSPGAIWAVAQADLQTASVDTTPITNCVQLLADTATDTCPGLGTHTNNTGTEQVFVHLTYPNYPLNFLFFSVTVDLEATAISRFEAGP